MSENSENVTCPNAPEESSHEPSSSRDAPVRSVLGNDPNSANFSSKMTWDQYCDKAQHFDLNRSRFPMEILERYIGQYVAWEIDGSAIRAAGPDEDSVWNQILAEGDDPHLYGIEYIPVL